MILYQLDPTNIAKTGIDFGGSITNRYCGQGLILYGTRDSVVIYSFLSSISNIFFGPAPATLPGMDVQVLSFAPLPISPH